MSLLLQAFTLVVLTRLCKSSTIKDRIFLTEKIGKSLKLSKVS